MLKAERVAENGSILSLIDVAVGVISALVETRPEFPWKVTETVKASGDKVVSPHADRRAPQIPRWLPQHRGSTIFAAREDKGVRTIKVTKLAKSTPAS